MIAAANVLTDLYLSLAAVIGLCVLHLSLSRRSPFDPLTRRFLFGIRVTILLFAGRALVVITGGAWFKALVLLGAGLVPLAVLLLTEGLLRRHAPLWLKAVAGIGAVVFVVLAFVPSEWVDPARLWTLLAFQLAVLSGCGWLVWQRDKASLSDAENQTAVRLGLSLFLIVPLIAADFAMVYLRLPVQISAIGVLVLCWLALGLGSGQAGHRATLVTLAIICAAALVTGSFLGVLTASGRDGVILSTAIVLAALLIAMILNEARTSRTAMQSMSLLRHLAEGPQDSALSFLRGLQGHGAVEGAVQISGDNLADLDDAVLGRIFAQAPVLRRAGHPPMDDLAEDHISHLFDRYAASHIMQISETPRQLVALAMPTLATTAQVELEVDAVQRMAALVAKGDRDA